MVKYVLGIDPGLGTTGYCLWQMGESKPIGYFASGIISGDDPHVNLDTRCKLRHQNINAAVDAILPYEARLSAIYVEADTHRPLKANRLHIQKLFVLCGFLAGAAWGEGTLADLITSADWRPSSWKGRGFDYKAASLGQANAFVNDAEVLRITKRAKRRITDHNEADAVNIAQAMVANWKGKEGATHDTKH